MNPCGKNIKVGDRIYRHFDQVYCHSCHDATAVHLVPYTVASAVIETFCGQLAQTYNETAAETMKAAPVDSQEIK